jgi:hypothetical protein
MRIRRVAAAAGTERWPIGSRKRLAPTDRRHLVPRLTAVDVVAGLQARLVAQLKLRHYT